MATYCPTYKWGQTDSHVILTIDVNEEYVNQHDITPEGKVVVEGDVPKKGTFRVQLDLFGEIRVSQCQVQFKSRSMQIKLTKHVHGVKWKSLQKVFPTCPRAVQVARDHVGFHIYCVSVT